MLADGHVAFSELFDDGFGSNTPIHGHGNLEGGLLRLKVPAYDGFRDCIARQGNAQQVGEIKSRVREAKAMARFPKVGWLELTL